MLIMAGQKMLLGEGEKILLLFIFKEETWGVYALVSNFGSLILRLLFAPVEEIAFSFFAVNSENGKKKGSIIADNNTDETNAGETHADSNIKDSREDRKGSEARNEAISWQ